MTRYGAVVVFKKGVTKEQAEAALKAIAEVMDAGYSSTPVREFDTRYGGPVWYIP